MALSLKQQRRINSKCVATKIDPVEFSTPHNPEALVAEASYRRYLYAALASFGPAASGVLGVVIAIAALALSAQRDSPSMVWSLVLFLPPLALILPIILSFRELDDQRMLAELLDYRASRINEAGMAHARGLRSFAARRVGLRAPRRRA